MNFSIREIDFETIMPVWRDHLWPGRTSPIEPVSSMVYMGGYNLAIKRNVPTFFGAYAQDKLIGVNSAVQTASGWFRSRGIWVAPIASGNGVGRALLAATEQKAKQLGGEHLWTIPRQSAMPFYARCGFIQASDWFDQGMEFGPNAYAAKRIA